MATRFSDQIKHAAPNFNAGYRMSRAMYDALAADGAKEPKYGAHRYRSKNDKTVLNALNGGEHMRLKPITAIILH